MAAWLWSIVFSTAIGRSGVDFTGMDWQRIQMLILIVWAALGVHWFGKRLLGLGDKK